MPGSQLLRALAAAGGCLAIALRLPGTVRGEEPAKESTGQVLVVAVNAKGEVVAPDRDPLTRPEEIKQYFAAEHQRLKREAGETKGHVRTAPYDPG